jgi:uncharacterized protein
VTLSERVRKAPSPLHGLGCFARVPFADGEHIGTFEGPEVQEDGPHVLWVYDPNGGAIARRGSNLLRWMNHSESPNAALRGFELYALRPISAGDEITIDYSGA